MRSYRACPGRVVLGAWVSGRRLTVGDPRRRGDAGGCAESGGPSDRVPHTPDRVGGTCIPFPARTPRRWRVRDRTAAAVKGAGRGAAGATAHAPPLAPRVRASGTVCEFGRCVDVWMCGCVDVGLEWDADDRALTQAGDARRWPIAGFRTARTGRLCPIPDQHASLDTFVAAARQRATGGATAVAIARDGAASRRLTLSALEVCAYRGGLLRVNNHPRVRRRLLAPRRGTPPRPDSPHVSSSTAPPAVVP